jgi:hypothetical protein
VLAPIKIAPSVDAGELPAIAGAVKAVDRGVLRQFEKLGLLEDGYRGVDPMWALFPFVEKKVGEPVAFEGKQDTKGLAKYDKRLLAVSGWGRQHLMPANHQKVIERHLCSPGLASEYRREENDHQHHEENPGERKANCVEHLPWRRRWLGGAVTAFKNRIVVIDEMSLGEHDRRPPRISVEANVILSL